MALTINPGSERFTADGVVGGSGKPVRVHGAHMISGATAGVVLLRNGPLVSSTIWLELNGIANDGATFNFSTGVLFPDGCFYDENSDVTSTIITFATEI